MVTALLSLGSNLGEREENLRRGIELLRRCGRVSAVSSNYEAEPVGVVEQPWFLNCAVALETELSAEALLRDALEIERTMGRDRSASSATPAQKGPRTLDIDVVLFGEQVIEQPGLHVPHPEMHRRRFVLEPLSEIAPQATHPVLKLSVIDLLSRLPKDGPATRRVNSR